ncbi:MAG: UPF0175 family protein [Leptospiraceae bacterium]|nr:UPF0175 family protein [Leptospiraceae bacterium]
MKEILIQLPETAFASLRKNTKEMSKEIIYAAVIKWYELGLISQNKASEICNLSRSEFLYLMSEYKVSVLSFTEEEFEEELKIQFN